MDVFQRELVRQSIAGREDRLHVVGLGIGSRTESPDLRVPVRIGDLTALVPYDVDAAGILRDLHEVLDLCRIGVLELRAVLDLSASVEGARLEQHDGRAVSSLGLALLDEEPDVVATLGCGFHLEHLRKNHGELDLDRLATRDRDVRTLILLGLLWVTAISRACVPVIAVRRDLAGSFRAEILGTHVGVSAVLGKTHCTLARALVTLAIAIRTGVVIAHQRHVLALARGRVTAIRRALLAVVAVDGFARLAGAATADSVVRTLVAVVADLGVVDVLAALALVTTVVGTRVRVVTVLRLRRALAVLADVIRCTGVSVRTGIRIVREHAPLLGVTAVGRADLVVVADDLLARHALAIGALVSIRTRVPVVAGIHGLGEDASALGVARILGAGFVVVALDGKASFALALFALLGFGTTVAVVAGRSTELRVLAISRLGITHVVGALVVVRAELLGVLATFLRIALVHRARLFIVALSVRSAAGRRGNLLVLAALVLVARVDGTLLVVVARLGLARTTLAVFAHLADGTLVTVVTRLGVLGVLAADLRVAAIVGTGVGVVAFHRNALAAPALALVV